MTLQATKIWRDLWVNKARSILIILAIAVGVAAFGLMIAGRIILQANLREAFAASKSAHAVLTVSDFDAALIETVDDVVGVEAAEGRRVVQARIESAPDKWDALEVHAVPDIARLIIDRLTFEAETAERLARGEILLERDVAAMMQVQQGDEIRIKTLDDKIHTLRVVGFVNDLSRLPSSISLTAYGFVSMDTLSDWPEPREFNRLYVITDATNRADIEHVVTRVVDTVSESHRVFDASVPEPGKPVMGDNMVSVLGLLGAMGNLTLALSAFLVANVMSAVIARQIPQIGILKSMGMKTAPLIWLYLRLVLIFGVLALALSIPMGAIGAYFLADGMAEGMNFNITRFWLPPPMLVLQAAAAILVPLIAALFPILTGANITIREAISGLRGAGKGRLRIIDWLIARFEALPQLLRVSLRNTFRSKVRLMLTLAALSLAGAMFIAILGVRRALFSAVAEMQAEASYDVSVDFAQPYTFDEIDEAMRGVSGVVDYEKWGVASGRIVFADRKGGSIALIGVPDDSTMVRPSITEGRWLPEDERGMLFVNADVLSLDPTLTQGSELELEVADSSQTWTVSGIGTRGFTPTAYITYADFEDISGLNSRAQRVVVRTDSSRPEFQQQVEQSLLDRFSEQGLQIVNASTTTERDETSAAQMDILIVLLMAMVVLITVVGGLGLAITMGLNVMERTREIGILRSLGAKTGVIRRVVILEGVVIGVLSWVVGMVASIPLGAYLGDMLGSALLARPLDYQFLLAPVAMWLGLVVVIAALASLAPAENAARLTIRDTLTYE